MTIKSNTNGCRERRKNGLNPLKIDTRTIYRTFKRRQPKNTKEPIKNVIKKLKFDYKHLHSNKSKTQEQDRKTSIQTNLYKQIEINKDELKHKYSTNVH